MPIIIKWRFASADKWSDPASDPARDIREAKEQVRRRVGRYPNLFEMGPAVFNALTAHPKIKEQFKYTSSESLTTAMLAKYFDVEEVVVGKAVCLDDNAPEGADAKDVWGNDAALIYRPKGGNYQVPSFGYTYRLKGHPLVMKPYEDKTTDSWVYRVKEEWSPVLSGMDAGFLFQAPVDS